MNQLKIFKRILTLEESINKSLFLFGPRQTGKSFLLKQLFPKSKTYNLLETNTFLRLSARPSLIREELLSINNKLVAPIIIDEIQKLPILLDEVHLMIEEHGFKFILTGSSANKLKRGAANLLAGRAWLKNLSPLVSVEIPNYSLMRLLNFGALPSIYLSDKPEEDLDSYVGTYLTEEIKAEGLVRKIENFSRFLFTSALMNGELLNYENVASDAQVPPRTVREHYKILEDTLIGHLLEPFMKTKKRKAISTAKFYFFDVGVANRLAGHERVRPGTKLFGNVFEHFIFTELTAYHHYRKSPPLTFWRSTSNFEVDFLIGDKIAIEAKGTDHVSEKHLSGLNALKDDLTLKRKIVVSLDPNRRKIGDIEIIPVAEFLAELWDEGL